MIGVKEIESLMKRKWYYSIVAIELIRWICEEDDMMSRTKQIKLARLADRYEDICKRKLSKISIYDIGHDAILSRLQ